MAGSNEGSARGLRVLAGLDDADLVRELGRQQCEGVLWLAAVDDLAAYARRAFHRTLRGGVMATRTVNRGRPIRLTHAEWLELVRHPEDADDLFFAALEKQIALFAARTCAGCGWVEGGGSGLREYFFNGVLLQLANPVRSWRRARIRHGVVTPVAPDDVALDGQAERGWGPEETFLATEAADDVVARLETLPRALRDAILLRADTGFSWRCCAEHVGVTLDALLDLRRRYTPQLRPSRVPRGDQPT